MSPLLLTLIFILSLAVLVKASDTFTAAAEKIGITLGMSPFIVGVTIVAVGTSLPELVSSILAVYQGASEVVVGNVLGSKFLFDGSDYFYFRLFDLPVLYLR